MDITVVRDIPVVVDCVAHDCYGTMVVVDIDNEGTFYHCPRCGCYLSTFFEDTEVVIVTL